jgi:hypothetical protein
MARYKFQGRARDTWGNAIANLDIYIYKSNTSKTIPAKVYSSRTITTGTSAAPQTKTNQYGFFKFWVDDTDYTASTTKFDIYADGLEYTYVDIFNIKHHGTLSGLFNDDHKQYAKHINVSTKTTETTAYNSDVILADGTSKAFTVHLKESTDASITVKKIDNIHDITVKGISGKIDGQSNKILTSQHEKSTFVWDGSNWFII